MTTSRMNAVALANSTTANPCSSLGKGRQLNAIVMQAAQVVWPTKMIENLRVITGYSPRAIAYWMSGQSRIPADALALLIRSEFGLQFLSAIMVQSNPSWWAQLTAYRKTINASRLQNAARRELQEALNADARLTSGIERATAALAVQDEDFARPQIDAVRTVARVPHRAVAQRTGRGK